MAIIVPCLIELPSSVLHGLLNPSDIHFSRLIDASASNGWMLTDSILRRRAGTGQLPVQHWYYIPRGQHSPDSDSRPTMPLSDLYVVLGVGLVAFVAVSFFGSSKRRYPPGPPARPLVGNILDVSPQGAWTKFTEYKSKYGLSFIHASFVDQC